MKIAVVGAGFTGLSAAFYLAKSGHDVTVFEKDAYAGGLAAGFIQPAWKWTLEQHYHHWFANDNSSLALAKEINYKLLTRQPKTSVYLEGEAYRFDSPISVLTFPKLSIPEKLRMAIVLGIIRYTPFWKMLEGIKTDNFLRTFMGKNAYEKIWEPQLENKFGAYAKDISLAWFWARLKKRTASLSYPEGGFSEFANFLVKKIEEKGGKFLFGTEVKEIKRNNNVELKFRVRNSKLEIKNYDAAIATLPSLIFLKIAPQLPKAYKDKLKSLKGIGAINLVLRLKEQFLKDGAYWLSICDRNSPFVAVVEHTNFMNKENYNNEHIVYLGKYLPSDHEYMKMDAEEILKKYDSFLQRINPNYKSSIISLHLFKSPFAQPIISTNYSQIIPPFKTPLEEVYLANMQQVYPWDRGTNYAIEMGEKVAKLLLEGN